MTFIRKYLIFSLLGILSWTCSTDNEVLLVKDVEYFPITVGAFQIYDVEESQFTVLNGQEDFVYQLKSLVTDSFQNTEGGITYVIQRSKRTDPEDTFEYLDTWSARVESSQVVVNESNISFIRLAFPLVEGKQWNGNALNNLEGEESCGINETFLCDIYQVVKVGMPFDLNGTTLTETIEIEQNNNVDIIVKQDVRLEVYARNIGLVYKESTLLNYCTVGSCIGQQQVEDGFIFKQTLIDYGKE